MDVAAFSYELPPERIAQRPRPRGTSRLLVLVRHGGSIQHRSIADLPDLLVPGDLVVVNDTKVLPARLFGKDETGRTLELLLVQRLAPADTALERWHCLAKPGKRARPGRKLEVGAGVVAEILAKRDDGSVEVAFPERALETHLDAIGTAPLPPYIDRPGGVADERDRADYQTVYARSPGAIAAPTAGLHFTDELLGRLRARGIATAAVTLHVGLGTFKPVKVERVEEHRMDVERGEIPEATAEAIAAARREGRRVVAVGTTTVRALESSWARHGAVAPGPFETGLFITPGFRFGAVDALLTNFHLPRSTLLMLVSAFAGRESVLAAYREAIDSGYLVFSYGDAMLIV